VRQDAGSGRGLPDLIEIKAGVPLWPLFHPATLAKRETTGVKLMSSITKLKLATALLPLALCGCSYGGAPASQMAVPVITRMGTWFGAQAVGPALQKEAYEAMTGQPLDCRVQAVAESSLACNAGREMAARNIALGHSEPRYTQVAAAVARCDAGKIPDPPFHEDYCDAYREIRNEIDSRVAELKASGAV
jgi:hypothetical protein